MKRIFKWTLNILFTLGVFLFGFGVGVLGDQHTVAQQCLSDDTADGSTTINSHKFFCADYERFNDWLAAHASTTRTRPGLGV